MAVDGGRLITDDQTILIPTNVLSDQMSGQNSGKRHADVSWAHVALRLTESSKCRQNASLELVDFVLAPSATESVCPSGKGEHRWLPKQEQEKNTLHTPRVERTRGTCTEQNENLRKRDAAPVADELQSGLLIQHLAPTYASHSAN